MKLRLFSLAAIIIFFAASSSIFAQINTVLGMFTDSPAESFAGGVSGDGRFVVIESRGNIATVNPRNADNNVEIFLFDYAQRRIFQITDTKAVLIDPDKGTVFSNIRVEIINTRPTISNDGRWIAFSSNATTSTPEKPDATNPGSFDGNDHTDKDDENPLTLDGNLEMWLYEIPAYTPADLTEGDELPLTPLDTGAFTRVTNTPPSQLPVPGTETSGAFVADDNHDASINDDGTVLAFVSTRDLIKGGNPFPEADNDEIFTYSRVAGTIGQVTETPRGPISNPIYNKNPSISGDGTRIVFTSTGDNPIVGMTGGENPESSRNEEIFIANLAAGVPAGDQRQITVTTPLNPGNPVNILDLGRRISRDGRFVAFDSYADLADEHGGTNQTAFASFIYDYTDESFARVLPRSDADSGAGGGDVQRYPGFTDYDANGTPSSIILHSRMNITPVGTIPTDEDDGLNPLTGRPVQFYRYPITLTKPDPKDPEAIFTRLTSFPAPNASILPSSQPLLSNTSNRIVFNLAIALLGTGNFDQLAEVYYSYEPPVVNQAVGVMSFATGASRMPISPEEVPTPTPTPTPSPTPSPTPTPTPNPSPTPTPSPSPSPTPETPPAVHGLGNGMLAVLHLSASNNLPITPKTAVGAIDRRFMLPMELGGVSMTIGGINCGLKSISRREIIFVAPQALPIPLEGQEYEVIINNRGTEIRGKVTIVVTRPDVFRADLIPAPGGRAFAHNVVNRVHTTEPFTSNTIQIRGGKRVPTRLRLRATGIANAGASVISVGFGSQFTGTSAFAIAMPVLVEPGIYAFDILVPAALNEAGDVPITITVNAAGTLFRSRLDDTAPRLNFL